MLTMRRHQERPTLPAGLCVDEADHWLISQKITENRLLAIEVQTCLRCRPFQDPSETALTWLAREAEAETLAGQHAALIIARLAERRPC